MTTFDERERGFEAAFARDEALEFKAQVRRDRELGRWAGALMGLNGAELDAYAQSLVTEDMREPGDADVHRKVVADLQARRAGVDAAAVRAKMDELWSRPALRFTTPADGRRAVIAPFSLRPARALDAMAIARWFPTRREAVMWGGPSLPQPVHGLWLAREVARLPHYVMMDEEGQLAGVFGVVFHLEERRAHLIHFAVAPHMRGRGVGRTLAEAAVEVARSQGAAERLTLQVYADNTPARRAYEGVGFQVLARAGRQQTPEGQVLRMSVAL